MFLILVIVLLFGVGIFLIVATLKGWEPLLHPPKSWVFSFPDAFLRRFFGEQSFFYFNIFIGIAYILATIWLVIYVMFYL